MFRAILGVIAGFIVMVLISFLGNAGLWLALGQSFGLKEGTTELSTAWIAVDLPLAFVAAIVGGFITALVAPSPTRRPVKVLAGLVLVLGLGMAVAHVAVEKSGANGEDPSSPTGTLSMQQAMTEAVPPTWYHFTLPFLGVVGVLAGGGLRRQAPLAP